MRATLAIACAVSLAALAGPAPAGRALRSVAPAQDAARPDGEGARDDEEPERERGGGERAISVQLHLHGPFSEGLGSVDSQSSQAEDVGVEVLWWSEHDYRIGCYRLVSSFGFEGLTEPIDRGEPWTRRLPREDDKVKLVQPVSGRGALDSFEFSDDEACEGERSLRVRSLSSSEDFRRYLLGWKADRGLHRRPMATAVEVRLAVLPELVGPHARGVIRIPLSEHTPHFQQHALEYLLVGEPAGSEELGAPERGERVYSVPVAVDPGRWNRLTLEVSADLRRGFPELDPGDDSFFGLELGVESRAGAEARVLFDDLRVSSRHVGAEGFEAQRRLLAARNARAEGEGVGPRHLQGVEISYEARHLNEFGLETVPFDYDRAAEESGLQDEAGRITDVEAFRDHVTRRAVEQAHARGALISYNHMFGAALEGSTRRGPAREEVLAELRAARVFGADLLEVGYRDRGGAALDDHLWVWDRLAQDGLFLVGVGVSDFHGGAGAQAWRRMANNFVSWIWAAEPARAELLEGLRRGRVFFGDPARFDGTLDLEGTDGLRMGDVLVTDRVRRGVTVVLEGLKPGTRVRALGPAGVLEEWTAAGGAERRELQVPCAGPPATSKDEDGGQQGGAGAEETPGFVRVEAHRGDGTALVLSNPIWFVRPGSEGLPGARVRLDLAGVRDRSRRGVELRVVELAEDAGGLRIGLAAHDGELVLALDPGAPGTGAARLEGLAGEVHRSERGLTLTGLEGQGVLVLER